MLRLEWEPLAALLDDGLHELVKEHWEEVGVHKDEMPLAVNYPRYRDMERAGILLLLAARLDDRLIGYASWFDLPHLHYHTTSLFACDAIYVTKKRRHTGAGIQLIDTSEQHFIDQTKPHWCRITYHDRHGIELLGPVLRRRGYVATDTTYSKMVRA